MNKTLLLAAFSIFFSACGGSPKEEVEEKFCFVADAQLTKAYANLIIKGNSLQGLLRYETPKAGMNLYEVCSITGQKKGDTLTLTLTTADTDTGQGLGASRKEVWILQGDMLVPKEENVSGVLKKVSCDAQASFSAEAPPNEAPQTYKLEGMMGGTTKIEMLLSAQPNPEDKKTTLWEGYYLAEGKNTKISLKGLSNSMGVLELEASAEGNALGKFMIEADLAHNEQITCIWIDAKDQKELETVLRVVK